MSEKERGEKFVLRIKPSIRQILEEKAKATGVTLSEYLRRCGLEKQLFTAPTEVNRFAYLELGEIANQLEQLLQGQKITRRLINSLSSRLRKVQTKLIDSGGILSNDLKVIGKR